MGTYTYLQILNQFLREQQNNPQEIKYFTAKECGYPTVSLNAMVRRGMINKNDKGFYITADSKRFIFILKHLSPEGFIHLKKSGEKIGMFCLMGKEYQLLDCNNNHLDWRDYDLYWNKEKDSWRKF